MKPFATELVLTIGSSLPSTILLKVTLTTAIALVATYFAKRSSAAVRHVLLAAAFALLLALPIASTVAPSITIPLPITSNPVVSPGTSATVFATTSYSGNIRAASPRASSALKNSRYSLPSPAVLLLLIWIAGVVVFILPVLGGLWQTRSLRRSGLPWPQGQAIADRLAGEIGIERRVDILLHESAPGPMTCGVSNPAVLLPVDATTWSPDELTCALIHELEHVRRADWTTRCLARALCACYWFHPLVWAAWRQFVLEAERACDDAVLQRGEATAYADQLVGLAQRLLNHPDQPLLAMANRHDLAQRVSSLLDHGRRRGRAGISWVCLAFAVSAALAALLSPLQIVARQTSAIQTTTADNQKFEIASIKPCREEDFAVGGQRRQEVTVSPGRVTVNCIAAARIIFFAYAGVGNLAHPLLNSSPSNTDNIRGGPGWLRSDHFVIEAKAQGTPDREMMMGPMLRALLEERFHVKTHRETEEVPLYALTAAKGGLKIQPIGADGCTSSAIAINLSMEERLSLNKGPKPVCGNFQALGDTVNGNWTIGGTTLTKFANQTLSNVLDRYVIDKTGMDGMFNIHLSFALDDSIATGVFGGRPSAQYLAANPPPADIEKQPNIFTALEEQLGLKLDKTRGPREYLVIDNAEKPLGFF